MRLLYLAATVAVAGLSAPSGASAQSLEEFGLPAEVPPASYEGRQYVDSRGCVYTRAGIDGVTTWVPRLSTERTVICGAEPTLITTAPAADPAPEPTIVPEPATTTTAGATRTAAAAPAARSTQHTSITSMKTGSKSGPVVRDTRVLRRATRETVASNVYIAPRRVFESQLAARDGVFVPHGYEPVWEDDRLSLTRAHQTYSGQDQMAQFWGNSVPRKLVRRQESGSVVLSTRGQAPQPNRAVDPAHTAPVLSTRSIAASGVQAPSHRYVQAGVFASEEKAREAARLMVKAGLPAAISPRTQGGDSYMAALAGPFASQADLDAAFLRVRQAYPGAKLRR